MKIRRTRALVILILFLTIGTSRAQPLISEFAQGPFFHRPLSPSTLSFSPVVSTDYNGDGIGELVGLRPNPQILNDTLLFVLDGATRGIIGVNPDVADRGSFLGFFDLYGTGQKSMIVSPRDAASGQATGKRVLVYDLQGQTFTLSQELTPPPPPIDWTFAGARIKGLNVDGDPQTEIVLVSQWRNEKGMPVYRTDIWGAGFTAAVAPPSPPAAVEFRSGLALVPEWETRRNVRTLLSAAEFVGKESSQDFDGDGRPNPLQTSYFGWDDSLLWVMKPGLDQPLATINMAGCQSQDPGLMQFAGYYQFIGETEKQLLFTGREPGANRFIFEIIGLSGDCTSETTSMELLGVADVDNDGADELILADRQSRRLAVWGVRETPAVRQAPPPPVAVSSRTEYTLSLKYETPARLDPVYPQLEPYPGRLDLNGDGADDIGLLRESETDTTALGLLVIDGASREPLWQWDFPAGAADLLRAVFRGFFDFNGDGEKEALFGNGLIVPRDETPRLPAGTGFELAAIFDWDNDGFPDLIGRNAAGRLQVWGRGTTTSTVSPAFDRKNGLTLAPNPFRETIIAGYRLTAPARVALDLFDLGGRQVARLAAQRQSPGEHQVTWASPSLPKGPYLLRLTVDGRVAATQIVVKQ